MDKGTNKEEGSQSVHLPKELQLLCRRMLLLERDLGRRLVAAALLGVRDLAREAVQVCVCVCVCVCVSVKNQ